MRLNLLLDSPGDCRSGYINVDPFAPDDGEALKGDVVNLNHCVDDGEATEIVALDILDYIPGQQADECLTGWLNKLAHGGVLTVGVVDIREVARAVLADTITLDDANELIHGKQEKAWQFRKASYSLSQLVQVLANQDYKILRKVVQNYRAVVTCQRP